MGRFGAGLALIGLVGLIASCGHLASIDHNNPLKPISAEMVHKIKHRNGIWYK